MITGWRFLHATALKLARRLCDSLVYSSSLKSSEPMPEQPNDKQPQGGALQTARQTYNAFDNFVAIREDDSTLVMAFKLLLRFIGIFVMILLSPFLIIGLFIAFAAVL